MAAYKPYLRTPRPPAGLVGYLLAPRCATLADPNGIPPLVLSQGLNATQRSEVSFTRNEHKAEQHTTRSTRTTTAHKTYQ